MSFNPPLIISQELGLSELRQGAASNSLRSILSTLTLLMFHLYITVILGEALARTSRSHPVSCHRSYSQALFGRSDAFRSPGTGETNLEEAEALLEPYLAKFPNVSNMRSTMSANGDLLVSVSYSFIEPSVFYVRRVL